MGDYCLQNIVTTRINYTLKLIFTAKTIDGAPVVFIVRNFHPYMFVRVKPGEDYTDICSEIEDTVKEHVNRDDMRVIHDITRELRTPFIGFTNNR